MSASSDRVASRAPIAFGATRREAMGALRHRLEQAGIESAALDARLLLCAAAGLRPTDLILAPDAALDPASLKTLAALARRRAAREPISRILGKREFWSLELALTPDALDPRADTETLVEAAVKRFATRRGEPLRVLDLGTGSGALICALLSEFPLATGIGVDVSPAAAATARANLARCGLGARGQIRIADWNRDFAGSFDLIVANPPYVASAQIALLAPEVARYDPRLALDGGADGLKAYRALAPRLAAWMADGASFFLEIGQGQEGAVAALLDQAGLALVARHYDLAGICRALEGARR